MSNEEKLHIEGKIAFLKYALTYLENRISIVDNKAAILIAIQAGLFAVFGWSRKLMGVGLLPPNWPFGIPLGSILDFSVTVLTGLTLLFLAQTVRPARYIFCLKSCLHRLDEDDKEKDHLMGFTKGFPAKCRKQSNEDYEKRVNNLTKSTELRNYQRQHYSALQLLQRKYKHYRWAGVLFKYMIVLAFIRLLLTLLDA